jgi:glycosyltransferase involved in cell wall biosynthesis
MDVFFRCAATMVDNARVHFTVVGDGNLRSYYMETYGHLPNLTFLPRIPKTEVQSFLLGCDLLYFSVHESAVWHYGLSLNKVIDYMLAAKPILASYSGFQSMINEAQCGSFVPSGDPSALRTEIERYSRMDSAELHLLGQRGRSWLLANRDYKVLAADYVRLMLPGYLQVAE